jgi:uncharacterized protein (TIGR00725 family)
LDYSGRISIFGGRDITPEVYENTVEIGRLLAQKDFLVFCGGGSGVMEAISKGVCEENGTVIGILKGRDLSEGNEFLTIPIATGMDIARNALLAYAFQLNKAVIGYETWDIDNVIQADSPHDVLTKLNMELNRV